MRILVTGVGGQLGHDVMNEGGYISWYDFTCEIFKQAGYTTEVIPVTTEEMECCNW